jgi:hypothetical protein
MADLLLKNGSLILLDCFYIIMLYGDMEIRGWPSGFSIPFLSADYADFRRLKMSDAANRLSVSPLEIAT